MKNTLTAPTIDRLRNDADENDSLAVIAAAKARDARSAAAEILAGLNEIVSRRDSVANCITRAERELKEHSGRNAELEQVIRAGWENDHRLHDEINEIFRRDFLIARLQAWLKQWQPQLIELDAEVLKFRQRHGIDATRK